MPYQKADEVYKLVYLVVFSLYLSLFGELETTDTLFVISTQKTFSRFSEISGFFRKNILST